MFWVTLCIFTIIWESYSNTLWNFFWWLMGNHIFLPWLLWEEQAPKGIVIIYMMNSLIFMKKLTEWWTLFGTLALRRGLAQAKIPNWFVLQPLLLHQQTEIHFLAYSVWIIEWWSLSLLEHFTYVLNFLFDHQGEQLRLHPAKANKVSVNMAMDLFLSVW